MPSISLRCTNTKYGVDRLLCTDMLSLTLYGCMNTIYGCSFITLYGFVYNYMLRMCEYNIRTYYITLYGYGPSYIIRMLEYNIRTFYITLYGYDSSYIIRMC